MPDGLRPYDGKGFLMIEGGGSLDHITVASDSAAIETIRDGFVQPTSVTLAGHTAWVAEGQLSRLAYPGKGEAPRLPFRLRRAARRTLKILSGRIASVSSASRSLRAKVEDIDEGVCL